VASNQVVVEDIDHGMNDIVKEIKALDGSETDIGLWGNGGNEEDNLAQRAATNEFGTHDGRIPARPFNRRAFDENVKELQKSINKRYNKLLDQKMTAKKLLQDTGAEHEANIKNTIDRGGFRPNAPATIARKGSSKPLIDEGDMRNRIEHREKM
jgi:hypothetical protein